MEAVGVLTDASAPHVLQFHHVCQLLGVDPVGVVDEPVRVRDRQRLCTQFDQLLDCVLSDVATAGHEATLAFEGFRTRGKHLLGEVDGSVARRLRPDLGSAPVEALAGEDAGELVGDPLVLPEQEADLPGADTDVARWHVGELADVTVELCHEGLAETTDLSVALSLRVKVGTTLGPAHGQGGEGVLDDLFEGEELQQSQIDRRVEPEATLERSDGAVHLDAIAAIDLDLAIVVDPADAEHDHSLGLDKPLEYLCFLVIGVPLDDGLEGSQHFTRSL